MKKKSLLVVEDEADLPAMNGLALLAEVRKMASEVPFCLFTGGSKLERAGALALGANFFLQKSELNPETLKAIIASAFT